MENNCKLVMEQRNEKNEVIGLMVRTGNYTYCKEIEYIYTKYENYKTIEKNY